MHHFLEKFPIHLLCIYQSIDDYIFSIASTITLKILNKVKYHIQVTIEREKRLDIQF